MGRMGDKMNRIMLVLAFVLFLWVPAFAYDFEVSSNILLSEEITHISLSPESGKALALSQNSKSAYVIDEAAGSLIRRIPLSGKPLSSSVYYKEDKAFILTEDDEIVVVDLVKGSIIDSLNATGIRSIAVDNGTDRIFFGMENKIVYEDLKAPGASHEMGISGACTRIFADKGSLIGVIQTADSFNLEAFDPATGAHMRSIPLKGEPSVSAADLNAGIMLVAFEDGSVSIIDVGTFGYLGETPIGQNAAGMDISSLTGIALITDVNRIAVLDSATRKFTASIGSFSKPAAVAIDSIRNMALVSHAKGIAFVKLENPLPQIDLLVPRTARSGDKGFTLLIEGANFVIGSFAQFNSKDVASRFGDSTKLQANISPDDLTKPGDVPVTVTTNPPGGGTSNALMFRIYNPAPVLESITPSIAEAGAALALRVKGRNFFNGSTINLNGENLKTRFISSILLEAEAGRSLTANIGEYPVVVINPRPESFTSAPKYLSIVQAGAASRASGLTEQATTTQRRQDVGSLRGRIVNTNQQPIEGVRLQIKNLKTETDFDGNFMLENVPAGRHVLIMHGSAAKEINGHYPTIPITVDIQAGIINEMPFQPYLHRQKDRNFKDINPAEDTVLTDPEVPGFELRIPKGVKITGWDGKPNLKVSVRTVPTDRLPVKPIPENSFIRTVHMFYFDKVGGGVPDRPVPIKSRNDLGLLPGEKAILWYYDESPNDGEAPNDWAIAGTGTVTPDGMYIVSDPGVGIPKFCCGATGWGSAGSGAGGGDDGCKNGCCGASGGGGAPGGGGGGNDGPAVSGTAGDPVDLATGFFIHAKQDLYLPGVIPVSISRYYRSGANNLGMFGKNTYFEYDWWLGTYQDMLLLVKPGNYQYRFPKQADGTYIDTTEPAMRGAVITVNADSTKLLRMKEGSTFKFDQGGRLIEIADRNGNRLTLQRLSDYYGGYLSKITTQEGRTVTFNHTYTGAMRTDSIVDSEGRTVRYTYETDPFSPYTRLKSVMHSDGSTIQYNYDSAGRMSEIINEKGVREVLNEYDANNRVIRQTHSDGGVYTFNYTVTGGIVTQTSMTAPNGGTTTWRFNNYTYITDIATPDGTTTYEREPVTNKILSVTDALGRRMTYTYDSKGRVTAKTDNAGNVTTYEYEDAFSRVTKITDALGSMTTMTYDTSGNLASLTTPDNKTTTLTYNSMGKPLTVTDAAGNASTMEYDTMGNLTRVTDPLGNSSKMVYDNLSKVITATDAKGKNTDYTYDIVGKILTVTDQLGNVTRYNYDIGSKLGQVMDAKLHSIRYEYDARDRVTKMTDQLGNSETYAYDTSDNLATVTDRKGQTTIYTYDLMRRVTRIDYADGSYVAYTYDAGGRLTTINDSVSGSISYTYTGTGCGSGCSSMPDKIAGETTPLGTINYTYDAIGRRTSMTVSGQSAVNYAYDTGGRMNGIDTLINGTGKHFAFSYDALGRRSSVTLPNGVTTNYSYDNGSHLLNLQHLGPTSAVLESVTYAYGATGNRTSMDRQSSNLPLPNAATNTSYNSANQMLTFNEKNILYDANGNMISVTDSCGTTNYTWDARNRLTAVNGFKPDCSALIASFKYDALGRRIEKTINGRTIQYLYDGLNIVQEIENGQVTVNYVRTLGIDDPLSRIQTDGTVRYYQKDALGSVIALTDETGNIKTTYAYDPFGNVTIAGETSDNPFQYTGRENDGTGLYYYRARYYSPELQRFISEDPIRFWGGLHFFTFVENNPMTHIDPYGLSPCGNIWSGVDNGIAAGGWWAMTGAIIGGAVGGSMGGPIGGIIGGIVGGEIGGALDPPGAGQANYGEPVIPIPPKIGMPPPPQPTPVPPPPPICTQGCHPSK